MAFLKAGDHLLMPDQLYGPARAFCDDVLTKFGVEVTYYDGGDRHGHRQADPKKKTAVVYLESPGSLTFEMQDVAGIAGVAKTHGAVVLMDNTWASPIFFRPLEHGVDCLDPRCNQVYFRPFRPDARDRGLQRAVLLPVRKISSTSGYCAGPDDIYMALRGLRTLGVRMRQHQESALAVARWLQKRPEVQRVMYPALPDDPGHEIWKRDYLGASALFGFSLNRFPTRHLPPFWIIWSCSSSATAGADMKA